MPPESHSYINEKPVFVLAELEQIVDWIDSEHLALGKRRARLQSMLSSVDIEVARNSELVTREIENIKTNLNDIAENKRDLRLEISGLEDDILALEEALNAELVAITNLTSELEIIRKKFEAILLAIREATTKNARATRASVDAMSKYLGAFKICSKHLDQACIIGEASDTGASVIDDALRVVASRNQELAISATELNDLKDERSNLATDISATQDMISESKASLVRADKLREIARLSSSVERRMSFLENLEDQAEALRTDLKNWQLLLAKLSATQLAK